MLEIFLITLASLFAGFIDAIVGGGGLILLPALFAAFPTAPAASLMGTSKCAAFWGTAFAAWQFSQKIKLNWHIAAAALSACIFGSALGACALLMVSNEALRKALPFILMVLLVYTLVNKELGRRHTPRYRGKQEAAIAALLGLLIGFYDGFFGPGTGSFFVFALVRFLGYDFLSASAYAKLMNAATNFSALTVLAYNGHVWWHIAVVLIVANLIGSLIGTRLAMKRGADFVRKIFIFVVFALVIKTAWDVYFKT